MIVPRPRLLAWTAALAVPLAFAAAGPPASTAAAGIFAAFALVAVADAVVSRGRLRGVAVELPDLVRLTVDRQGSIEVLVRNESRTGRRVRVGLELPPGFETPHDDRIADLPGGTLVSRFGWPCTARRRGRRVLRGARLEDTSRLGFWDVRRRCACRSEIRVYPNLMAEGRSAAALFLRRASLGVHAQRQVGKGRDFEKLREYIPGDGFDDIHWKATAKRGHPVTKVFQIERTQEVYVVLDASRLSARLSGAPPRAALERFITAALVLAQAAERQGDLFGLVVASDRVHSFLRARRGKAHYDTCREAIYTLEPRIVTPDFEDLAAFLRLRLRRRALLLFLTDLDDAVLAEGFVKGLDLLRRHHLVLVGMLHPAGARPLFSDPAVTSPDDLYRALAGHIVWHGLQELARVLKTRGATFMLLDRETLSADLVTRYVDVKRRQVL
jgi:uncharacterized protein (DUF58 family)